MKDKDEVNEELFNKKQVAEAKPSTSEGLSIQVARTEDPLAAIRVSSSYYEIVFKQIFKISKF